MSTQRMCTLAAAGLCLAITARLAPPSAADSDHDWLVTTSPNDVAEVVEACWDWSDGNGNNQVWVVAGRVVRLSPSWLTWVRWTWGRRRCRHPAAIGSPLSPVLIGRGGLVGPGVRVGRPSDDPPLGASLLCGRFVMSTSSVGVMHLQLGALGGQPATRVPLSSPPSPHPGMVCGQGHLG
jgi:hypothetical protein